MRKSTKKVMPDKVFIEIWQTSSTISEVVDRTGVNYYTCYKKAQRMKERGIPLKEFTRYEREYLPDLVSIALDNNTTILKLSKNQIEQLDAITEIINLIRAQMSGYKGYIERIEQKISTIEKIILEFKNSIEDKHE